MWDFPRPPIAVPDTRTVTVSFAGRVLVETTRAVRVLETSQAPAFYLPLADVDESMLRRNDRRTGCEWKGVAHYFDIVVGDRVAPNAAWGYDEPTPRFDAIRDHIAVYAASVDRCTVNGHVVEPNAGDFYGGWITPDVVGPFKGGPGSMFW